MAEAKLNDYITTQTRTCDEKGCHMVVAADMNADRIGRLEARLSQISSSGVGEPVRDAADPAHMQIALTHTHNNQVL